jgi:hypothetical protein
VEIERGSTRLNSVEKSLLKRLWTCKTESGWGIKLTTRLYQMPRLRMGGAMPSLLDMPSWCAQKQLVSHYIHSCSCDFALNNSLFHTSLCSLLGTADTVLSCYLTLHILNEREYSQKHNLFRKDVIYSKKWNCIFWTFIGHFQVSTILYEESTKLSEGVLMNEISMHQSPDYFISSANAMCKQWESCLQWEVWRCRYSSWGCRNLVAGSGYRIHP